MGLDPIRRVLAARKAQARSAAKVEVDILERYLSEAGARPKDPAALFNLGMAYYVRGRRADAQAQFERVVSVAPDHADARYYLGLLLAGQGSGEKARGELEWVRQNSSNAMLRRMAQQKLQHLRGED